MILVTSIHLGIFMICTFWTQVLVTLVILFTQNVDQSYAGNVEVDVVEKLQWKIISFLSMAIHHSSDKALTGTFVIQTCHSITGSFENMNKRQKP